MEDVKQLRDGLVSVIMPAYNTENYITKSIQSVINQTYKNWELIIVDDFSSDKTVDVVRSFDEDRITVIQLEANSGAAKARNIGIQRANGEFLAFLDSDDLWTEEKLEKQISFMKENDYSFTSTEYAEMNDKDEIVYIVKNFHILDYNGVLKYCPGNSTIIYNAKKLGKFYVPNIRKRNDYAMWLQVIKKAKIVHGLKEAHTIYRIREGSLSDDKARLIKYQWKVYREIEKLSIRKSLYLLAHKIYSIVSKQNKERVTQSKSDFLLD